MHILKDMYNSTVAYGKILLGTNLCIYSEVAFPAFDSSFPCNHGATSSIVFECFLHVWQSKVSLMTSKDG